MKKKTEKTAHQVQPTFRLVRSNSPQARSGQVKTEVKGGASPAKTMAELLANTGTVIKSFTRGDIVEGKVVSRRRNEILIDVGAKSEGIIDMLEIEEEPTYYKDFKVGDTVTAAVVYPENDQGYLVLSLQRAASESKWRAFEEALDSGKIFDVKVIEFNKGGLLVDAGILGFVPISHLDRSHFEKGERAEDLIGRSLKVKVIEINKIANRLVFSEKEALSSMTPQQRLEILGNLKVGKKIDGVVSAILPFGLFVEVKDREDRSGAVEGLVHISEISWEKVESPGTYFRVGDVVKVKVLEVDPGSNKLSLLIKALKDNPWDKVAEKYKVGDRVKGKVSKIVPFGAFIILEPGLEGLIHVSETVGPLKVGEEVETEIITVEPDRQKLGLSIRKLKELKVTYK